MEAELNNKSDNEIQLKKDDILRLKIRDAEGNDTGNVLEFDLTDLELPLRLQEMGEQDKRNRLYLKNELQIIEKKQDHKGKKLLSSKQEAQIKAVNEFMKKEVEMFNLFLGENGVEKLLNGRKLSINAIEEILQIIKEQIMPKIEIDFKGINEKIMKKYSNKRDDVIE